MKRLTALLWVVPIALSLPGPATSAQTGGPQSEAAFRAHYRATALAACRDGASSTDITPLTAVGIGVDQLCICVIDRYLAQASLAELRRDIGRRDMPAAAREATAQCVTEMMRLPDETGTANLIET